MNAGTIVKVSGPLVVADKMNDAKMFDVVRVSDQELIGEVIELRGDRAWIQVYEETGGLGPGDPVYSTGGPLSVELGPGLLESIYDGIQRPLDVVRMRAGDFIARGVNVPGLDREKRWAFQPVAAVGDEVGAGDVLGTVQETPVVEHKIMVPPDLQGTVKRIEEGEFTVEETVAVLDTSEGERELTMMQRWPVREPRPYRRKLAPEIPLITGQRVIDTFFPVGKGGTACVPGPFGSGKTVIQHQLAKWADAEIIVYVGCGERGNEMASVLLEFPELEDPHSGHPLMKRTVLIANTSNMPVAAREASVYTGITIAEYFRDMGYSVALMADSTSRWAEAMREISGRLEEMPGEAGYPAYLGTKVAAFYERAGRVICQSSDGREGTLTAVGAVSPPGGDLSDPVVQATLRVVKVFWSLEDTLAYRRHFPAISWLNSYSLYQEGGSFDRYFSENVGPDFVELQRNAMRLLQKEADLEEIVRLVGVDSLSSVERLTLETARSIREDFLHQNAFHEVDTYASMAKQYRQLRVIMRSHQTFQRALDNGATIEDLAGLPVNEEIARARFTPEENLGEIDRIDEHVEEQTANLMKEGV